MAIRMDGGLYSTGLIMSHSKEKESMRFEEENKLKQVLNVFGHDLNALKYIASHYDFNVELFKIFATKESEKHKEELFKYLYEVCDNRFDFTERCLLIEDVFGTVSDDVVNTKDSHISTYINSSSDAYMDIALENFNKSLYMLSSVLD